MSVSRELSHVHFIGIGGAGMSAIARILLQQGSDVSGSDQSASATTQALSQLGARVSIGHSAHAITGREVPPSCVVISQAAIGADNPELVAAREAGIAIRTRSEVLAALAAVDRSILVTGTHGKTSTTSMLVYALQQTGVDPSFAVGGQVLQLGVNARGGSEPLFVAEADESDGSLVGYTPDIVITTNVEPDHLDYFASEADYFAVFDNVLGRVPTHGTAVCCLSDTGALACAKRAAGQGALISGYALGDAADFTEDITGMLTASLSDVVVNAEGVTGVVTWWENGQPTSHTDRLSLSVPGEHMALNAVAALIAARHYGVDPAEFLAGLATYTGVGRRFEIVGEEAGVLVVDDYAHHPTEVEAVLAAAQRVAADRGGRICVAFQPHMYTRTKEFHTQFAAALDKADWVALTDVFGAREEPMPGVSSALIVTDMTTSVQLTGSLERTLDAICDVVQPRDLVFTMGAGTITSLGPQIVQRLAQRATES